MKMPSGPFLKRLPVLLFLGFGIFLWRGGLGILPSERELWWSVRDVPMDVDEVELTLHDDVGELIVLTRQRLASHSGREVRQLAVVKQAVYRGTLRGFDDGKQIFEQHGPVSIPGGTDVVVVELPGR